MAATLGDDKVRVPVEEGAVEEQPFKTSKDADAALSFTLGEAIVFDEADNKRVRRTIDRHIIPWMFFTFMVQYFDKTLLSYASVMGIMQDANLSASQYAW